MHYFRQNGFTLVEVLVVMGVVTLLLLIVNQSLFRSQAAATLDTTITQIENDVKAQQASAMDGATPSAGLFSDYSIWFSATSYTLFAGDSYDQSNGTNFVVPLEGSIRVTATTLPDNTLTFSRLSGDVVGFIDGNNSLTVEDIGSGTSRVLRVNRRGIFVQ